MRMRVLLLTLLLALPALPARAQDVDPGYWRSPSLRFDPFRHVMIRHWGFTMSIGASAMNNSFNLADIGAIIFLANEDSLGLGAAIDALGLVPAGSGLNGFVQGGSRVSVGGPLGGRLAVGFSVGGTMYGSFDLVDDAVTLFRDGNTERQEFSLGDSRGAGLGTAEFGVHSTLRLHPTGDHGPRLTLGGGLRFIRPLVYGSISSPLEGGGTVRIPNASQTGDEVTAEVQIESFVLSDIPDGTAGDYLDRGRGVAVDLLARLDFGTGLSLEAMVANVGSVDINDVERSDANIDASAPTIDQVLDMFNDATDQDTLSFEVRDSVDLSVTLPRIIRLAGSISPMSILQLDAAITAPVTGEFKTPAIFDLGSTWRFARIFPLRAGLVFGGHQGGIGLTGGFAIESRHLLLNVSGGTYGGMFRQATGAGGRFEFGVFF